MKLLQCLLAIALCLFTGCGSITHTTFRVPASASISPSQRLVAARAVDSVAARLGYTDWSERWAQNPEFVPPPWARAYRQPIRRGSRILMEPEPDHAMLVYFYQMGDTPSPQYIEAQAALAASLRRLFPDLIVECDVIGMHM